MKLQNHTQTLYNYRILGDATGELGPFKSISFTSGWYNDGASFVQTTAPVLKRGGIYYSDATGGMYRFNRRDGGANVERSFRLVLTP